MPTLVRHCLNWLAEGTQWAQITDGHAALGQAQVSGRDVHVVVTPRAHSPFRQALLADDVEQTLEAPELARLLAGQGKQKLSPCLDLKVPGLQADSLAIQGKDTENKREVRAVKVRNATRQVRALVALRVFPFLSPGACGEVDTQRLPAGRSVPAVNQHLLAEHPQLSSSPTTTSTPTSAKTSSRVSPSPETVKYDSTYHHHDPAVFVPKDRQTDRHLGRQGVMGRCSHTRMRITLGWEARLVIKWAGTEEAKAIGFANRDGSTAGRWSLVRCDEMRHMEDEGGKRDCKEKKMLDMKPCEKARLAGSALSHSLSICCMLAIALLFKLRNCSQNAVFQNISKPPEQNRAAGEGEEGIEKGYSLDLNVFFNDTMLLFTEGFKCGSIGCTPDLRPDSEKTSLASQDPFKPNVPAGRGNSSRSSRLGIVEKDCKGNKHHAVPYNDPIPGIWP
ncbi:hypothetical protein EYF80_014210 [Liparis tanakae]|uniref:Uncharacterized protein n=1 Tax=Liparis tanakae TaxID=230148 RepID=A0A4Z2IDT3_9TELE|nr:hypothetical protein EYF80_014210 [Liparis tanakae]